MTEENGDRPGAKPPVFDRQDALERVMGDETLLDELLGLFDGEYAGKTAEMRAAIARRDGEAVRFAAHAIKGAAANLSLVAFREAAFALETAGKEGRLDDARKLLDALANEYKRVGEARSAGTRGAATTKPAGGAASTVRSAGRAGGQKKKS